jgi:hypothetical protein
MNPSAESPLAQLQTALDEAGDALACADLPKLLAAELKLGAALNSVSGIGQADRESIERARAALLRCRRLGAALTKFTRVSLDIGGVDSYSRQGEAASETRSEVPVRGSAMEVRG